MSGLAPDERHIDAVGRSPDSLDRAVPESPDLAALVASPIVRREEAGKALTAVGASLEGAQKAYKAARDRLEESSQAVIPRARRLVELGVKSRKKLPEVLEPDALEFDESADAPEMREDS